MYTTEVFQLSTLSLTVTVSKLCLSTFLAGESITIHTYKESNGVPMLQQSQRWNSAYLTCPCWCVDVSKIWLTGAFNVLNRKRLDRVLSPFLSPSMARRILCLYSYARAKVVVINCTGHVFDLKRCMRLGYPVSPKFFSVVLALMSGSFRIAFESIKFVHLHLSSHKYADDQILLTSTRACKICWISSFRLLQHLDSVWFLVTYRNANFYSQIHLPTKIWCSKPNYLPKFNNFKENDPLIYIHQPYIHLRWTNISMKICEYLPMGSRGCGRLKMCFYGTLKGRYPSVRS